MKTLYKSIRMADPRYVRPAVSLSWVGADEAQADSVVGSPDYMAIETLRGSSYSFSVDYWSLGCILFECVSPPSSLFPSASRAPSPKANKDRRFLAGFPPFSGATPEETWSNLKNWNKCLRRPHYEKPEDRMFNLSDVGWDAITWCVLPSDTGDSADLSQIGRAHV